MKTFIVIGMSMAIAAGIASADECIKTKSKVFSELTATNGRGYVSRAHRTAAPRVVEANIPRDESLPQSAFEQVVADHENEVRHCVDRRAVIGKAAAGNIGLWIVVAPSGKVARASATSTSEDRVLEECLVQSMRRWRFPAAGQASEFSMPLVVGVHAAQARR